MGKRKLKQLPKKSKMITGYIIYASEIRREIIKANPGKDFGDISKIVGVEWRKLGQEEKVMFEKRAEEQNSLFRDEWAKMSESMIANEAFANAVAAATGVAPDLDKLADVAAERAANEETQQQQQQQQEAFISANQQQQDGSFVSSPNQDSFMSSSSATNQQQQQEESFISGQDQQQQQQTQQQSQLRSPLPNVMSQYANSVANYNAAYGQQSAYYSQLMMSQTTPALVRSPYAGGGTPNDILLQQPLPPMPQQPFSIVQHPQPSTNVQYCNNPACCASGRYQPYPTYPYSPPDQSVTPSAPQQQQQQQRAQSPQIKLSPSDQAQQQHLYKMNNIIYRKPSLVKLRPKDVGTQTDPIAWMGKIEKESPKKQQLRFSKEFIQHMSRGLGGTSTKITTAECHW